MSAGTSGPSTSCVRQMLAHSLSSCTPGPRSSPHTLLRLESSSECAPWFCCREQVPLKLYSEISLSLSLSPPPTHTHRAPNLPQVLASQDGHSQLCHRFWLSPPSSCSVVSRLLTPSRSAVSRASTHPFLPQTLLRACSGAGPAGAPRVDPERSQTEHPPSGAVGLEETPHK